VLVNLNYRIGVHLNVVKSRIPALVCSLQSSAGFRKGPRGPGPRPCLLV